jgi:hypothetical protein
VNIETLINEVKALVADYTHFDEHAPRLADTATPTRDSPNAGIFRVVVMGTGKTGQAGLNRYADLAVVVANPQTGNDGNEVNKAAAVQAEELIDVLAAYDTDDAQTQEELEAALIREHGRSVTTISCRVNYSYTEE